MNCGRDDCTGVHDKSKPYAIWCQRTKDAHAVHSRESQRRYKATVRGFQAQVRDQAKRRGA